MSNFKAVIFDMDGTLVDNSPYHREAWKVFCKKYGLTKYSEINNLFGQTNDYILPYFFNNVLTKEDINRYSNEKEAIYREIYKTEIKPINGLILFLQRLTNLGLKLAVATSANKDNVNFVLSNIQAQHFFECVVDESFITKGKPDPEIFLVCADKLKVSPSECIVFEDSVFGVEAAHRAGMKVIGIDTTVDARQLEKAEFIIKDYNQPSIEKLLFQ